MKLAKCFIVVFLALLIVGIGTFFIFYQRFVLKLRSPELEATLVEEKLPLSNSENALDINSDITIKPQKQPYQPPDIIKAVYLTSWSVSKEEKIDYLIDIAKTTEINAVVIDIKDFSGYVAYNTDIPEVEKYGAEQIRIVNIGSLIEKLHEQGIYVIARITVFQDPVLAHVRPDLAVHSREKLEALATPDSSLLSVSSLWLDKSGLAWIDPAVTESWDYNIAIAKDAINRGFDELNFDYVRFPSDGNLQDMSFPFWDGKIPRHTIIREFFKHLREEIPEAKISIDLFGLSTVSSDDLGVGQIIEDAFEYSDYVCPMIYPSHYADGFIGFQNPAEYPYEVVKHSMESALRKLAIYKQSKDTNAQLRPWLQDFNLGAVYDTAMIRSEIRAVYDAAGEDFSGFMLWNSWNFYTKEALEPVQPIQSEQ